MEEKLMYQAVNRCTPGTFWIVWNELPDEVLSLASKKDYIHNLIEYVESENELKEVTVVYFRKVDQFRKRAKTVETDNIIYGV